MKIRGVSCALVVLALVSVMAGCGRDTREPASEGATRSTASGAESTMMIESFGGSGQLADRNPNRVPRVVGATVPEAARKLRRAGYGCDISGEATGESPGPRRVVVQRPRAGSKGFEAEQVKLTVSKPFSVGRLPRGCEGQR